MDQRLTVLLLAKPKDSSKQYIWMIFATWISRDVITFAFMTTILSLLCLTWNCVNTSESTVSSRQLPYKARNVSLNRV